MNDEENVNLPAIDHGHNPVLLQEIRQFARPTLTRSNAVAVDCTIGRGGHTLALCAELGEGGSLLGLDADARNLDYAAARLAGSPVRLFHENFSRLDDVLDAADVPEVDFILADLGISTNQLLSGGYGLSFAADEPLDMRLDQRSTVTAADLVNTLAEGPLADLLYQNADEKMSRRIARKIVEARRITPIQTTRRLSDIVRSAIGVRPGSTIDPATRTFMALRMKVNAELDNLLAMLRLAPKVLRPGGRLAVISFHSVEDRIVKTTLRQWQADGIGEILTRKPLAPSDDEVTINPRSRSAKLRVFEQAGAA